jgi:hypothetical protein
MRELSCFVVRLGTRRSLGPEMEANWIQNGNFVMKKSWKVANRINI